MPRDIAIVLARRPSGPITPSDFVIRETADAAPGEGELLVRPEYVSLDPYLSIQFYGRPVRGAAFAPGDVVRSRMVGTVVGSRHAAFREGDVVRGIGPWQSVFAIPGSGLETVDARTRPSHLHLSVLGTSGITAWVGLHRVARIASGETMIVSGAAGTIGSIAGQLARRHGLAVIGIAGGPEKCAHARETLRFEQCLDYRDAGFAAQLRAIQADVHFENVGGALLDAVLPALSERARIALCGMIAHYDERQPHQFHNLHLLLEKLIEIRPYRVSEHAAHHAEALDDLAAAVSEGAVMCSHTIAQGLEAAPDAFVAMMRGQALGKSLVRVQAAGTA